MHQEKVVSEAAKAHAKRLAEALKKMLAPRKIHHA